MCGGDTGDWNGVRRLLCSQLESLVARAIVSTKRLGQGLGALFAPSAAIMVVSLSNHLMPRQGAST